MKRNPVAPLRVWKVCVVRKHEHRRSRAASLGHATIYNEVLRLARIVYPRQRKHWEEKRARLEAAQALPPDFDSTRPEAPPNIFFPIKDDSQPYTLTAAQASARLNELNLKAQAAWKEAIALAKTPEEKAQAYFLQGWGMRLLYKYLSKDIKDLSPQADLLNPSSDEEEGGTLKTAAKPLFQFKNLPTPADILKAFDQAITLAPDVTRYWQAKGDALRDGLAVSDAPPS